MLREHQHAEYSFGIRNIGIPRIGAGIGGLAWDDVKNVLTSIGNNTDINLIVVETFVS